MEQHPIPRQITTFEFKLVGFMTLKQFLYLLVCIPTAFVFWRLIPIPILNIAVGTFIVLLGVALAFLPVNDRPLDVWIKNFIKRLTSPTQYTFQKHNNSLAFLQSLYFVSDPHKVATHIESKEKLAAYMATQPHYDTATPQHDSTEHVQELLQTPTSQLKPASESMRVVEPESKKVEVVTQPQTVDVPPPQAVVFEQRSEPTTVVNEQPVFQSTAPPVNAPVTSPNRPFFIGIVKNNKKIPLPGIMIYVKDESGKTLRLLKTNPHGVFATYNPLAPAVYTFEIKDPKGGYFFDTMKLAVENTNVNPFEFYSKELL